ncbi:NADH-quinone oxidoreductase subunit NuoE [Candidatus Poribacteria bacterium]|nr:NADH-quinone oxidoreductase subunit NuoE [Candidatus Poribacteria bacterium]
MGVALDFREVDVADFEELLDKYEPGDASRLIPFLQDVQEIYGYLPGQFMERIAKHLRIPKNQVFGVATFYAQFSLKPRGKNVIKVCTGTSCHVRGSKNVLEVMEKALEIKAGDTTPDLNFTLETVACLGTCFLSPVMMINDKYYGKLTPHKTEEILKEYQNNIKNES